jgi:hypothetical protein
MSEESEPPLWSPLYDRVQFGNSSESLHYPSGAGGRPAIGHRHGGHDSAPRLTPTPGENHYRSLVDLARYQLLPTAAFFMMAPWTRDLRDSAVGRTPRV